MEIEKISLNKIKPYKNNAKIHDEEHVGEIIKSIENFGFNDPIAIDENNVIIEGHGRYMALKELLPTHPEFKTVDVIRLSHLSEEQKKAYILVHNKLTMNTGFDKGVLDIELSSIPDIDMTQFGFEIPEFDFSENLLDEFEHQVNKDNTQYMKENILNLAYAQYEGTGKYDIPEIEPVKELPDIAEWIGFNYVLSDKSSQEEKAHKGVHFFVDDYQFERVWNNPNEYIERLSQYGAVLSPDFSPYGDMPLATQIFNHYRKHWIGAYWQEKGITVIPTIRASTDPRSFEWYLDGEPKGGIVAISSMWVKEGTNAYEVWKKEYGNMVEKLKPIKIFIYGEIPANVNFENVERIEKFSEKRWG